MPERISAKRMVETKANVRIEQIRKQLLILKRNKKNGSTSDAWCAEYFAKIIKQIKKKPKIFQIVFFFFFYLPDVRLYISLFASQWTSFT